MTDLQLALLGLAAILLIALIVHGKWQERQLMRRIGETLRAGAGDALLEGDGPPRTAPPKNPVTAPFVSPPLGMPSAPRTARIEPRLDPPILDPVVDRLDEPELPELPAEDPRPAPSVNRLHPTSPAGAEWVEDPLLDFVLELHCAHAVDGVAVYDAATRLVPAAMPTPTHLLVWNARAQQWTEPDRFGFYSELLVATQLGDRDHVLGEVELSRFVAAVQQVAMALDADFDAPDIPRVAQQAEELDQLCSRYNVRIGLTLEARGGPWESGKVSAAAALAGLVACGPAHWQRLDEAGRRLFTLAGASLVADRLVLELDVPTAPADTDALKRMFSVGALLAEQLGAELVDDNGRAIDAVSLAAVEAQLVRLYEEMRNAGIEPAGPRALRLYGT